MIYVTGDTHGSQRFGYHSVDGYIPRLNSGSFPDGDDMTKDDYIVILGDFGGVWGTNTKEFRESKSEERDLNWLDKRPFTTLFVPGNHENYDRLTGCKSEDLLGCWLYDDMLDSEKDKLRSGYPRKPWNGGYVRVIRPSVLMLEPGVFNIGGHPCFAYGGAQSHDISGGIIKPWEFEDYGDFTQFYNNHMDSPIRVYGTSWWPQEQPDEHDELNALRALTDVGNEVDFVFTHSPASSDQAALGFGGRSRVDMFLEGIKQSVEYKHWFSGHLHLNKDMPGCKEHILYEQILRIA